jgi:phosphatidylglycerol lysyltransferase
MAALWRRLVPVLGVLLFGFALAYLWTELRALSVVELARTLKTLPLSHLGLAAVLTVVNYIVLTGYDQLAFVYLRRSFPRWQIGMASFVGYAISNNLGFAILSGASARYRFYSRWGLTPQEISRIVIFYSGTFWLGLLVLGGWSLVVRPPSGLRNLSLHQWAMPVGVALFALALGYALFPLIKRGSIRILNLELAVPAPRLVVGQFVLSIADWALAGAVFWVLIPSPRPLFVEIIGSFVVAQCAGLVSNVPGGLAVFEGSMLLLLKADLDPAVLVPVLLAFRVIYYLMPLMLALGTLVVDASYERRYVLRRWGAAMGTFTVSMAPTILAIATFLAGSVLLFSGATPAESTRLHALSHVVPLPIVELSHFLNSLVGLGLLLISQALVRRVDAAWTLTVAGLVLGITVSLLKGLDYEEALVLAFVLALVMSARGEFDRRATLFERTSPLWLISVFLVVLASIVLGEFAFGHVQYSEQPLLRFEFQADAPRFLRATVGVAVILLAVGLRLLLSPAVPRLGLPTRKELAEAEPIIQSQRSSSAFLVYLGDKALLWNDERSAFLMYAVRGRTWVALHDPVGPPEAAPGLIRRFLELVDDTDGFPVFYQIRKDDLHRYADFGLSFAKVGEEALVPLSSFSLDGGARKKMRFTYNRLEKDGATFRFLGAEEVPNVLPELRAVSDDWLAFKSASEKRFSLGFFDESYLTRFPVAVLEVGGRLEAFASVWPGPGRVELSVDLMRHRATAPKNAVEGLFIFLMLWGRREGYEWFNLGMAPLSGLEPTALAPVWVKVASYLYRYSQPFYNFQGLRSFKEKFSPQWEPKYLAYPGGLALPRVLADVSALIAGGYRGIFARER